MQCVRKRVAVHVQHGDAQTTNGTDRLAVAQQVLAHTVVRGVGETKRQQVTDTQQYLVSAEQQAVAVQRDGTQELQKEVLAAHL